MLQNPTSAQIKDDVLHSENHSKLSPEEIAKAVAHHNRHHPQGHQQNAPGKGQQGTKKGPAKMK
jgi:hypothetical protein